MNRAIKLILLMLITSCSKSYEAKEWENAPENYICTNEDLKRVEIEFNICNKSSYLGSYCYGSSLIKYCTKIKRLKNE